MSREQQEETYKTSQQQNKQSFANAQQSYKSAQEDVANLEKAIGDYAAANPFRAGGEYQENINTGLGQLSDAGASAEKSALQSQARRTGQNMNSANATAETISEANERALAGQLAGAENARIGQEADYNKGAVQMLQMPVADESALYGTSGQQAQGALNSQTQIANQPGFWDQLAMGALQAGAQVGSAYAGRPPGSCWVAAELYGGWQADEVALLRHWIFDIWRQRSFVGWVFASLYARYGERWAGVIHSHPWLRKLTKNRFDCMLATAERETRAMSLVRG